MPQPVEGATGAGDQRRQTQMAELLAAGGDLGQELAAVAEQLGARAWREPARTGVGAGLAKAP